MTSKLVVNTIESDTGISSVSFASSISMSSTSKFFFSAAGVDIGADTNINRPEAGVLGFNINSSEKVRITSAGLVGINESSPDSYFHVNSGSETVPARFESTGTQSRIGFKAGGTANSYNVACGAEAENFIIYTNNAEKLRIDSSGRVGIGTDAPAGNLEIDTASSTTMIMLDVSGTNFARIGHNSSSGVAVLDVRSEGHTRFLTNGNNERLRIDSSGRLLLSTTTAGESNSSADDFVIGNSGSGNSGMSIITGTSNNGHIFFGDGDNDTMGGFRYQHSVDALQFYAGGSAPFYLKSNAIGLHESYPIANSLTIRGANTDDTPLLVLKRHTDGAQSDGEIIGKIQFMSNENNVDSGNHQPRAEIHGVTVSTSGAAKLDFYTVPNSTTTPVKAMTINQLGQVTTPNQPSFQASFGTSSYQIGSNSGANIIFTSEEWDIGTNYNTSNGRFTAPIAGKYFFGIQLYLGFSVTAVRVIHSYFTKNGSSNQKVDLCGGISNAGGSHYHPTAVGTCMMNLSANDYVTFNIGSPSFSGAGNSFLYPESRFFGYLIG